MLQQRRKSDNKIWWSIIQLDDDQNTSKFSFKFNFSDYLTSLYQVGEGLVSLR